jgi:REP element-mobilizing transposase RayT
MSYNREQHHRRSVRLPSHDYSTAGAYFITVCTWNRECLFGEVVGGEMQLNEYGEVVRACWMSIPEHVPQTTVDVFVVMPNHVHGVVWINRQGGATDGRGIDGRGTACRAPTGEFGRPVVGSLATIVRSFKSAATKRLNDRRHGPGLPVWQRNYYEHVVRDEDELHRIHQYIADNPRAWDLDRENPLASTVRSVSAWEA